MRNRTWFSALSAIVLLIPFMCAFLWAQAATPQNTSSPAPAPVLAANLASEAEEANLRLRQIKLDLDKAVALSDIERQLAVLGKSLQRIRPVLESAETLQEEELFNFRQELARFSLCLKQFQQDLVPRSRVLEEGRQELRSMELLWKITADSLSVQEAPDSSRDLVGATRKRIDETIALVRIYRPVLLTMQNSISEKLIAVDALLARINDAIDGIKRRLFTIDAQPLWRAVRSETGSSAADLIPHFNVSHAQPLLDYIKENKSRFLLHLVITSFLFWLLTAVSRSSRKWLKTTGTTSDLNEVLHHPLAAALVVSLLLSFSIYPNPPLMLYRLPLLLMLFPLARVVSGALSRKERVSFYFLGGLYILWRLNMLFFLTGPVFRIFALGLTCLGIFGLFWDARKDLTDSRTPIGPWRAARMYGMRVAAAILSGSVIANIMGNVTLSVLLSSACISSAYAGAAIFAGVLVLEGFILPLFDSPLAQVSVAISEQREKLQRQLSRTIRFGALIAWAASTLILFGVFGPIVTWLSSVMAHQWSFGRIVFSLGAVLKFVLTICISVGIARFGAFVAEKDILSRMKLPQGIPATGAMLVRDCIIAFGFILALGGAGVQWSQIVLVAGAIGVGVGFGLQQLVSSFFAGLILIFERPMRVGDTIVVGKMEGVVSRIGLRSSTILAIDGSEVICPNSRLISEDLINWTLSNQLRRVEVKVGVPHGTDPDVVLAVLKKVASDHPLVLQKPEPMPIFTGFGESSLTFALRFFALQGKWIQLSSEVCVQINNSLREKGIEIALPQRDIRITREAPLAPV